MPIRSDETAGIAVKLELVANVEYRFYNRGVVGLPVPAVVVCRTHDSRGLATRMPRDR